MTREELLEHLAIARARAFDQGERVVGRIGRVGRTVSHHQRRAV